jgi:hypothetical protein
VEDIEPNELSKLLASLDERVSTLRKGLSKEKDVKDKGKGKVMGGKERRLCYERKRLIEDFDRLNAMRYAQDCIRVYYFAAFNSYRFL